MWNISNRTVLPRCTTRFQQFSSHPHRDVHSKIIEVRLRKSGVKTHSSGSSLALWYGMIRSSESTSCDRHPQRVGSHTSPQAQPALKDSSTWWTFLCSLSRLMNSTSEANPSRCLPSPAAKDTLGPLIRESFLFKELRSWRSKFHEPFGGLRVNIAPGFPILRGTSLRLTLLARGCAALAALLSMSSVG